MICAAGWNSSALIRHEGMRKASSAHVAEESANLDQGGGFRLQSRRSRTAGFSIRPGENQAPIAASPAPLSLQLLKKVVPKFRKHERVARAGSDVPKFNSETPKPRNPGTIFPPQVSSRICAAAPRPKSWGQAGQVGSGKMGSGLFAEERTAMIRPDPSGLTP